mmetsp:Transcript_44144/g.172126  ORF Transcript_44144/g.172126 Transcript_44144/m.172126 type:complete len:242 (+) Transcript_44144:1467-2192(+)
MREIDEPFTTTSRRNDASRMAGAYTTSTSIPRASSDAISCGFMLNGVRAELSKATMLMKSSSMQSFSCRSEVGQTATTSNFLSAASAARKKSTRCAFPRFTVTRERILIPRSLSPLSSLMQSSDLKLPAIDGSNSELTRPSIVSFTAIVSYPNFETVSKSSHRVFLSLNSSNSTFKSWYIVPNERDQEENFILPSGRGTPIAVRLSLVVLYCAIERKKPSIDYQNTKSPGFSGFGNERSPD